uniref:interferon-induced GTP-binding protein Mx-like n=1 Tax=Monopterus albus TaxID=43700 RepID=UPI0009B43285
FPPFCHSLIINSGIVTRCPLELKMKRKKEGDEWYGKISYRDYEEEIEDPVDVEKLIRDAQDKMAGEGVGISDDLISLEIASPDVPDLTLIDLPGITRVAVSGQPENIGDQVQYDSPVSSKLVVSTSQRDSFSIRNLHQWQPIYYLPISSHL